VFPAGVDRNLTTQAETLQRKLGGLQVRCVIGW